MRKKTKQFLKNWIPPGLMGMIPVNRMIQWSGDYRSWREAQKASTGYDSHVILNRVRESTLKVKNGEACYERDSVLFDEIKYSWPLLAALMWVAAQSQGELNIIDFGGSLGSTYFQNKKFLYALSKVRWNIVEQRHFVNAGKRDFEDDVLKFYDDIESCIEASFPRTILFSSVIQYLEKPYEFLTGVGAFDFDFMLFDRTAFVLEGNDRLTVQRVSPEISDASYPCWFFDESRFRACFADTYECVAVFDAIDGMMRLDGRDRAVWKGMILRKKR